MSDEIDLKSEEKIIIYLDPFTREVRIDNCTRVRVIQASVDGDGNFDEHGVWVVDLKATFFIDGVKQKK